MLDEITLSAPKKKLQIINAYTCSEASESVAIGSPSQQQHNKGPGLRMSDEEMVRLHRDVLREVRAQPLALRRKIRLVRKAKAYIREHEGALDEKLAHGGGTMKDHLIRVKLLIARVYAIVMILYH
jgi:hypothetical protein